MRIRRRLWRSLLTELARRGDGRRESGAFLLGQATDRSSVDCVVYLDDLDPNCLTGGIEFNGLAFSKLWDLCERESRIVVGDVHTHPSLWVSQSSTDAANPMVAQAGHVALIVPSFARGAIKPRDVGVHRYDGNRWQSWTGGQAAARLQIRRWWQ